MAEHLEAFKKLTPKQRVMVKLYTDESNKQTYLKKAESFRRAGFCAGGKSTTQHSAASRMFNQPSIIAAIKELAPKSFDAYFVCDEMLANYNKAKSDNKLDLCHKILIDMGKIAGVYSEKKSGEEIATKSEIENHVKQAQEMWVEMQNKMSARKVK